MTTIAMAHASPGDSRFSGIRRIIGAALVGGVLVAAVPALPAAAASTRAEDCGAYHRTMSSPTDGDHSPETNGWTPLVIGRTPFSTMDPVTERFRFEHRQYRSYCVFDVDPIPDPILSAHLEFPVTRYVTRDDAERIVVSDVSTDLTALRARQTDRRDIWNDLGTGVIHGSRLLACRGRVFSVCKGWVDDTVRIPLNDAFIALLEDGGAIGVGFSLGEMRTKRCPYPRPKPVPAHCVDEWLSSIPGPITLVVRTRQLAVDSAIRVGTKAAYTGSDTINDTGFDQSVTSSVAAGRTRTYQVAIANQGTVPDRFRVTSTDTHPSFTTRFLAGTQDVTTRVTAGTYRTPEVGPGKRFTLTVKVTAKAGTGPGLQARTAVTSRSVEEPELEDVVVAYTRSR